MIALWRYSGFPAEGGHPGLGDRDMHGVIVDRKAQSLQGWGDRDTHGVIVDRKAQSFYGGVPIRALFGSQYGCLPFFAGSEQANVVRC